MAIEQLAEEVAINLEEAAEVTRKINTAGLGYFAVGLGIGAAVGFYFGYKFNREKIKAEAYKDAEVEVAQLREVYLQKTIASANKDKPPVARLTEDLGYSVKVEHRGPLQDNRPLPAPVPILDDLPENPKGTSKSMNAGWNYEKELKDRTPDFPYVIHQNEYEHSEEDYSKVTYTYWAVDDVVVDDETEHPVPHGDIVVGLDNLKFGHGSDDINVVYVRNDRLEMDMQISSIDRSFEEEVLGGQGVRDDDDDDDDS